MTIKKDFMAKKKIAALPKQEREKRWKQHVESVNASNRIVSRVRSKRSQMASLAIGSSTTRSRSRLSPGASAVVRMLTDLDAPPVRIAPQMGCGAPTGLFSVTQVFEPTTCTDSDNIDRFGALFQPIVGLPYLTPDDPQGEPLDELRCYPNLILESTSEYPTTNWLDADNYEIGNNTGSNLSAVDGASILFQSMPSHARLVGGGTMTPAMPFGTAPALAQATSKFPASFQPGLGDDGTNTTWSCPLGAWLVSLAVDGTGLTDLTVTGGASGNVLDMGAVVANAAGTRVTHTFKYTQKLASEVCTFTATGTTVTGASMWFSDFPSANVTDTGAVSTVRPVAMQVLATCIAPLLDRGGTIATALLPANDVSARALTVSAVASPGSPFKWEELSRFNLPGSVYSGPFERGTYTWWAPQDVTNTEFLPPVSMCQQDYPAIVVAGQYSPTGTPAGGTKPLRIIVRRVFEYTSDSQALNLSQPHIPYSDYVAALEYLRNEPHTMENDSHSKWFKLIKKGISESGALANLLLQQYGPTALAYKQFAGSVML